MRRNTSLHGFPHESKSHRKTANARRRIRPRFAHCWFNHESGSRRSSNVRDRNQVETQSTYSRKGRHRRVHVPENPAGIPSSRPHGFRREDPARKAREQAPPCSCKTECSARNERSCFAMSGDYSPGPQYSIIPAIATKDSRLTPRDVHVFAIIGTYTNELGVCWPSQSTIGDLAGVSRRMVQHCIRRLTDAGYLRLTRRHAASGAEDTCLIEVLQPRVDPRFLRQSQTRKTTDDADDSACSELAPPASLELAPPASPELAPPASLELAQTTPINVPSERYKAPPELDNELWVEWEKHRRAMRKPLTDFSRRLQWKRLASFGWENQRKIIETAIERGWQGLYQVDDARFGSGKRESTVERVARETFERRRKRMIDASAKLLPNGENHEAG